MKLVVIFTTLVGMVLNAPLGMSGSCPDYQSTQALIYKNNVNLRAAPAPAAPVLEQLSHGQRIRIVDRAHNCVVVDGRYGRWIKALLVANEKDFEGWIFDVDVAYPEMFVRVTEWAGPSGLVDCLHGDDWCEEYTFNKDGTFERRFVDEREDRQGNVDNGYLFTFDSFVLFRTSPETPTSISHDYITINQDGTVCNWIGNCIVP